MLKYSQEVEKLNNKERCLKFIKDFNNIGISNILKELEFNSSSFYTYEYSLENMQKITNKMREEIRKLYPEIKDNAFILNTKENNISYVKDISNISTNKILDNFKIDGGALYTLRIGKEKYELVINEIKKQLDELYQKYNHMEKE